MHWILPILSGDIYSENQQMTKFKTKAKKVKKYQILGKIKRFFLNFRGIWSKLINNY